MRVLGVDPGLRNLGWGVVDVLGSRISHVANGICHSAPGEGEGDLALRLVSLYSQLSEVLRLYRPDEAAVEHTFVNKDAVATLKLGQARGIALLVPAQAGITALSLVMTPEVTQRIRYKVISKSMHAPIRQKMVVLKRAGPEAAAFRDFLLSSHAQAVFSRYGYDTAP